MAEFRIMVDPYLIPEQYKSEIELVRKTAREFAQRYFTRELAREVDHKEEFPWDLYRKAGELGFIAATLPPEYGGGGLTTELASAVITEELVRADTTLGQGILSGAFGLYALYLFGTEEQKKQYIPPVARGEKTFFLALTEPDHGSDITQLSTVAKKEGDYYVLKGIKTFITNAPTAEYGLILAQTEPEKGYRGQTLFLIHTDWPGVDVKPLKGKMGQRASPLGEIRLDGVKVPKEYVVGGPEGLNKGFYWALQYLNIGRVHVGAVALGMMLAAFDRAYDFAQKRVQFGRPIIEFQLIQQKLAEMAQLIDISRLAVYRAHLILDEYIKGAVEPRTMAAISSITKVFVTENATKVIDHAIQILGGSGYMEEYDVERIWRDHRVTRIYEGTTEINTLTIVDSLRRGFYTL
ncbi:acyl-CoA dehydrogenase domain protein [Pyrobaculum calidifontis JCM 11548]|uniref:Acyl-CoA dehydrogenase domain protein n=2 Tax=Pyrobaculum calidifontis TaxID=181486 RepID=A3MVR5_PYRCJ|nr:acyl-CoA dehydrogenase domain protein [Pyrobaculum calidifontis JCM 11548]